MKSFILASFNIGASSKMFNRYDERDLYAVAGFIGGCGADVVAMQEVDFGCDRSGGVDMASFISKTAGYPYYHFITIRPFQNGLYGTAILSRFPIKDKKTINYKVKVAKQGTSCGYATLDINGVDVTVFNTHLSCESDEGNRDTASCLDHELREFYAEKGGFLCCGDFNVQPSVVSENIRWLSLANRDLHTYADRSIDNVLYTNGFEVSCVRTVDATSGMISDHNMLICRVTVL